MRKRNVTIWTILVVLATTSIGSADLSDGLVAYYPFNGNANDESGSGNHGSPVGGVTWSAGPCPLLGGAAHLDGTGHINVPDSLSLDLPGGTGTISAFIKVDPSSGGFGIVAKESSSSFPSTIAYELLIRPHPTIKMHETLVISDGTTVNQIPYAGGADLQDGLWHHIAGTWSGPGGELLIYRDGVEVAQLVQTISTINNISEPVCIGAFRWNVPPGILRKMTGDMDEVRIYNRALSADEIGQLAEPCPIDTAVDIKPGSCPNPLNVGSRGVLPVAILGTDDFDVRMVDPASVKLVGVPPLRWDYEDVSTPFYPVTGKESELDCTEEGPDGFLDLTLKFDKQAIVAAIEAELGPVNDGDVIVLPLTADLKQEHGGTPVEGEDVVIIRKKDKTSALPGAASLDLTDGLVAYYPFNGNASDASGNASDGTEYGGPSYVSGVCGQAIKFDGVDDWIAATCEDIIVAGTQGSFAISFWFKPTIAWTPGSSYPDGVLVGNHVHWVGADWLVVGGSSTTAGRLEFMLYDEPPPYPDTPVILWTVTDTWNADTWYHIVYSHDASTKNFSVWVNGTFDNDTTMIDDVGSNRAGEHISIARYNAKYIDMTFDELRLYKRALSPDEISQLAEPCPIVAAVDIDPDTLNVKGKGKWITCCIELPEGYDVGDVDVSTVALRKDEFEVGGEYGEFQTGKLMVKFPRKEVQDILEEGEVELTVTGQLTDGTPFEGTDTIRVIDKGGKEK